VMSLVQDARARSELTITLPVVGAELKDQPIGHRSSLRANDTEAAQAGITAGRFGGGSSFRLKQRPQRVNWHKD
jgi:hypothetical protein